MKNYRLVIEELNNEVVANEDPTTFTMNTVVDSAKSGDSTLLEQLHQATKVWIFEYYDNSSWNKKYPREPKDLLVRHYICTPRKTSKAITGQVVGAGDGMFAYLVEFHNLYIDQTGMPEVSLDELKALYQATQTEHTL